jgi:toxin ParE1/3/4
VARNVSFSPEAQADLSSLYDHIAEHSGAGRALAYIERIEQWCLGLANFPERGTRRDDLKPGLRIVGYEKRLVAAFTVMDDAVVILRILYGGRDLRRHLSK